MCRDEQRGGSADRTASPVRLTGCLLTQTCEARARHSSSGKHCNMCANNTNSNKLTSMALFEALVICVYICVYMTSAGSQQGVTIRYVILAKENLF